MNSDDDDVWAPPNDTPARKNERLRRERQAREQARAHTQTPAPPIDNDDDGDDLYSSEEDNYEDWIDRTPAADLESQLAAAKVRDTPAAATRRKKPTAALPAQNRVRPPQFVEALTRRDRPRSRTLSTRPRPRS